MNSGSFTHVTKRDGTVVPFTEVRITNAIYRAAIASGGRDRVLSEELTGKVVALLAQQLPAGSTPQVEQVQDAIEKVLIETGHAKTAKAFILYRNDRARERDEKNAYSNRSQQEEIIPWRKVWESLNWAIDHRVLTIAQLNQRIADGSFSELVRECEEHYQLEIVRAADAILRRKDEVKFVIIAGPSSSGKTTTTIKIAEHLKNEGFEFVPYHVDNYYVNLDTHPKDEFGDYDYEVPEAMDLALLNQHLREIYAGQKVDPPYFNFKSGKREGTAHPVQLGKGQMLLIDSLHGLFPQVTDGIPEAAKARIFIEPYLQLRGGDGAFLPWTDIRLIRRIVRDVRDRNVRPDQTIEHWHYVRRAELRYVLPHALRADCVVNSALPYELPIWSARVGKTFADWADYYTKQKTDRPDATRRALRVHQMLQQITPWTDEAVVPPSALLREFIGGSAYKY